MRILHAKIYGFGKWVDYSLDFPKTGPLFIYGENESGKTTFHQFILFMLFGMPPRQRKFYQPKMSSKIGGQLVIEDVEIGKITIERYGDRNNGGAICYSETGEQFTESWLKERLHHMNQKTYEAVFSFSALDLNKIEEMDEADLSEVLLSIGLTGSDNVYRVEKQLDAQIDALFKPGGRIPEINEQLNKLDALKVQLETYKKEEASYREKTLKAGELEKNLHQLQEKQQRLKAEIDFISQQHTNLPIIQEYQFLTSKKAGFGEMLSFPEKGTERLEKIKEGLRPLESERAVLKNNKDRYHEVIDSQRKQILPGHLLQELGNKQEEIEGYHTKENRLVAFHTKENKLLNDIIEELEQLQIDLQQTELQELSLPFYIEETWKQLQRDQAEVERDGQQLEIEFQQLNQLYNETLEAKRDFEQEKMQKQKAGDRLLGTAIILSIISLATAYFMEENLFYGISLLCLFGGLGQWFFTRKNSSQLELQRAETANKNQKISYVKLEEKKRMHGQRKQRLLQQIGEQLILYPFLEKINLSYWPEYYRRLKQIQKMNEEYLELLQSISRLQYEQTAIKEALLSFMQMNFPEQDLEDPNEIDDFIQEKIDHSKRLKERLHHNEDLLEDTLDSLSTLKRRIKVYQQEIDALLQVANVTTEEAFYKLSNHLREKVKMEDALEVSQRQLEAAFPNHIWKDFIHEAFDESEMKRSEKEKKTQAEQLEQEIESARSALASLHAELKRMESSDAYSEKLHQFEMQKEKLNWLAKEWSILKIEKEILSETKYGYRKKYLSSVLEKTANIFQVITGGKYIDVSAPKGKELFQITAADGMRYTVNELSQGTVNQLYISLRLAISKVMTEKKQFPFILDDAFVHFDQTRVKRMLKVLADIGTGQQVLMFTCKNDVKYACEQLELPLVTL